MTLDEFAAEMRPLHNQICILHDSDIVRLIGVGADDCDYYYIVRSLRRSPGRSQQYWGSAVGHIVSLKGAYPQDRYDYMDKVHTMNNAGPTDEFLIVDESDKEDPARPLDLPDEGFDLQAALPETLQNLEGSHFSLCEVGLKFTMTQADANLLNGKEGLLESELYVAVPAFQSACWPSDSGQPEIIFMLYSDKLQADTLDTIEEFITKSIKASESEAKPATTPDPIVISEIYSVAVEAARALGRDDMLRIDELPQGLGIVACFRSNKGLRSLGQSSLIQGSREGYGIVITPDGRIPRDAEVSVLLKRANQSRVRT